MRVGDKVPIEIEDLVWTKQSQLVFITSVHLLDSVMFDFKHNPQVSLESCYRTIHQLIGYET